MIAVVYLVCSGALVGAGLDFPYRRGRRVGAVVRLGVRSAAGRLVMGVHTNLIRDDHMRINVRVQCGQYAPFPTLWVQEKKCKIK